MAWPCRLTSETRLSSTAWRKRLKLTSDSLGCCCLVTTDQRSSPRSRRSSQRPRLRETGFKWAPGGPISAKITQRPRSGNARARHPFRRAPLPSGVALEDGFDDARRGGPHGGAPPARPAPPPQDLRPGRGHRQEAAGLPPPPGGARGGPERARPPPPPPDA